jgi:signal transduction histidine kinase
LGTDWSRNRRVILAAWVIFACVNAALMYIFPGAETIPYHLIWASFALVYGIAPWSRSTTAIVFPVITVVTGIALIDHARRGFIGWEEASEVVLMGVIALLLVWHVKRREAAQTRIAELLENERIRAYNRELATRFGSHELRTRLTIARGFTDLIHENTDDESVRTDAQMALSELDKAAVLATNLMTLVRVDAEPKPGPVDLDVLVDTIMTRWASRVERHMTSTATAGVILGDWERLEAAVDCLVENAVKFTEVGDSISIHARAEERDVVLYVEDDGAGIPPDELNQVTHLFHTGDNAGDRAGAGLGLAIVRAVVAAQGGSLEVSSRLGLGTRVTLRFPHGRSGRPVGYLPIELTATRSVEPSGSGSLINLSVR